ncbi:BTAD domain-containing putative transcriptional regulator, partial [Nocardia cyriacigeorgica]|uniref:BTAD domain-containing putative transcriptional regulator n=1 Tax=Nocardia cyriacigeorgica TaxID=135487 RepID=UPI002456E840
MVMLRVLGSFTAESDAEPIPLGGPRQRGVLALLVAARGQVVPVDRMVEDLWRGEAPARALASLQAYISNLRRLLEPGRPPRTPARLLVSAAPGYALRLPRTAVDAWRFEEMIEQARTHTDSHAVRDLLEDALALWQGPAFAEFADEPWAVTETTRLGELRLVARELHIATRLRLDHPATVAPDTQTLTREHPLREEAWRLHALALWSSGRQADALAALRRARATFADELGLDPGPDLVALEEAILTQRTDVLRAAVVAPRADTSAFLAESGSLRAATSASPADAGISRGERSPSRADGVRSSEEPSPMMQGLPGDGVVATVPGVVAERSAPAFVGRDAELSALRAAAAKAEDAGAHLAVVTGEAGLGKSTLLEHLAMRLEHDGWLVATGRCPDLDSAPPAWAWVQILRTVAAGVPAGEFADDLAPLLSDAAAATGDAAAGRFRLRQAVWAWLTVAAAERPVAVLVDDLHWADPATLELLGGCIDVPAPILVGGGGGGGAAGAAPRPQAAGGPREAPTAAREAQHARAATARRGATP